MLQHTGGESRLGAPARLAGADHFLKASVLAAWCWLCCALLQALLYLRPSPYGGPLLLEWKHYFGLALYYDLLGVWLVALPFQLLWLGRFRGAPSPRLAGLVHRVQTALLALYLLLAAVDHEILRFLGLRLTFSFMATYAQPQMLADRLFAEVLLADEGGPLLPLLFVFLIPIGFAWIAKRLLQRRLVLPRTRTAFGAALLIALLPVAAPANAWIKSTSHFRLRKTEAVTFALAGDLLLGFDDFSAPPDLDAIAAAYQREWLRGSGDKGWRFPDRAHPYLRLPEPRAAAAETESWNLVYLQLETFRGADMGFLRPDRAPSPTPFLDSLVAGGHAASWDRASSFGMPSINGLFASHCSITPHSRRYITSFTHAHLLCLPEVLRRRGYRTEMFNAGDSDWDNSTIWLNRWYDRLWRYPRAQGQDRPVFRAAARRLRALGRSGRPFMATLVSVSNHTPFTSREPRLNMAGTARPQERILNTTHYTDDVLRELFASLRREPWFRRTLFVIAGDHGFNLGEHGGAAGQVSLYRESLWVPLMILGMHPRLPAGRHQEAASLLDLAPTIAELLGIREANPWQGHSLLSLNQPNLAFAFRDWRYARREGWEAIYDIGLGRDRLYDAQADWLQSHDLAAGRKGMARSLSRRAEEAGRLNDYLLRNDRVWPRTVS